MESNLVQNLVNLKSLPETWAVKDFKEVVSDNSGGNKKLAKSNFLKEGDIAVVDQGKKLIAGFYNDTSLAVKTQPPYVVFGDHTRAFKYVDFPFIMGADGTKVLQPKKDNCETKYLYYFFLSINVPNTGYNRHFKYLKNLKIPLPPLDQQKNIVAILNAADAYRQKTKALIEKYDELTKSLFMDMFGDPVTNPKGWKEKPIGELADLKMGGTPSTKHPEYYENGTINWMKSGDIKGDFITNFPNKITQLGLENSNTKLYKENTVVIALNGQGKTRGTTGLIKESTCSNQSVVNIDPDNNMNSVFLHFQLKYRYKLLRNLTGDNDRSGLNLTILRNYKIYTPEMELQNQFAERVQAIEAQKAQAQASLAQAEDLFNSLLQRAFKGELTS